MKKFKNPDPWPLQELLQRLDSAKQVVYDSETSGLSWQRNHICGHVLTFSANPADSFYVPVRHRYSGNISYMPGPATAESWDGTLHPWEQELFKRLDRQGLTVTFHNGSFDLKFLWRAGLRRHDFRCEDTIINAPLLDEHQPKFGLEYCCAQAGVAAKKSAQILAYLKQRFPEVPDKQLMGHFWQLSGDDPNAVGYATGDGTSTWQLRDWQMKRLEEQELLKVWDVESRLIPVLARMTCTGIKVDEDRLAVVRQHVRSEINQLLEAFPKDFNVCSPIAVKDWCERHGRIDWPLTPTGKPSFPEIWLTTHAPGQQIVKVRKYETLDSSFLGPMQEQHLWNGRVHANFNQLRGDEYGTVTGRLSCDSPNLQQTTKHNKEMGLIHRSIFIPDERRIWSDVDFNQVEPRLLAYYSRAQVLLDGYSSNPPIDAHTAVSAAMNKNWGRMTKDERKQYRDAIGKRINQSLLTGGGKGLLTKKYGVPAVEAEQAWNDYFKAMPEIRVLQKKAARVFKQRGYVLSLLGRRARLNDDRDYTAVNRLLQCGNADLVKAKLVEVDEYLKSEGRPIDMLNTVHDSVDYQFSEEHRRVYDECLRIMTDFSEGQLIELDVPMKVDAGEGSSWSLATWSE